MKWTLEVSELAAHVWNIYNDFALNHTHTHKQTEPDFRRTKRKWKKMPKGKIHLWAPLFCNVNTKYIRKIGSILLSFRSLLRFSISAYSRGKQNNFIKWTINVNVSFHLFLFHQYTHYHSTLHKCSHHVHKSQTLSKRKLTETVAIFALNCVFAICSLSAEIMIIFRG